VDIAISNVPDSTKAKRAISNPSGYPYLAMPVNRCTRNGDDVAGTVATQYVKWQCIDTADGLWRCPFGSDETCDNNNPCDQNDALNADGFTADLSNTFAGFRCDFTRNTITDNYMQIDYYTAFTEDATGCPGTPFVDPTGYLLSATDLFATNVCVLQDDGSYISAKCDVVGGDISRYSDSSCTNVQEVLVSYGSQCSYFDHPSGDPTADRWFRRFKACYVAGTNIVDPTQSPTPDPTTTVSPTMTPSDAPSETPTTGYPSVPPTTAEPTSEPTISPTPFPSVEPTEDPTTREPTPEPTDPPYPTTTAEPSRAPSVELDEGEQIIVAVESMTFIQIIIVVLLVVYAAIGLYVWCHEKNKRLKIISGGTRQDRAKRMAEARKRVELQKRRSLQRVQSRSTDASPMNQPEQRLLSTEESGLKL